MMMKLKFLFIFSLFLLPSYSFADVLYSQTDSTVKSYLTDDDGGSYLTQRLGTGLSGRIVSIGAYVFRSNNTGMTFIVDRCTNSTYSSCTPLLWQNTANGFYYNSDVFSLTSAYGSKEFALYSTTTAQMEDFSDYPTSYFQIRFTGNTGSINLYGSASDVYTGGNFSTTSPVMNDPNVADAYFILTDSVSTTASGQFSISSPIQNQVTATGIVPVSFSYYNNSVSDYYNRVGIQIVNVTDGQTLLPMETSIIGSGSLSFSTTTLLANNKQYYIKAYMRSSTASSTTIYSSPRFFYTVSSPYPVSTLPDTLISTASSTSGVATSTVSGSNIGTTTLNSINPDSVLPSDWAEMVRTRFPFSYIYDTYKLITELAQGSRSSNASFVLPLGAVFTDPDTSVGTTTITLIDNTAITNTGYTTQIRNVISYSMYFVTGLYLVGSIMSSI